MSAKVLLVEDDRAVREALADTLELADRACIAAGSFVEAKDRIRSDFTGVILSDMRMPGRDGFHLLDYAQGVDPDLPVILLTGEGDVPMAVKALGRGAFAFLEKPCETSDLLAVLDRAQKSRTMVLENRRRITESGDAAAARRQEQIAEAASEPGLTLADRMARVEAALLEEALARAGGQAGVAAQALGLPRKTFYDKLARHGIRADHFRTG
ncbi:response regulator [Litorisediminicola beolgyonensis]|uniref:Response regulator n=1 Tax=Litorisediminicola beolgyonensis TaxID=1173614 RepID=A0ABW3ZFT5_9RHOB